MTCSLLRNEEITYSKIILETGNKKLKKRQLKMSETVEEKCWYLLSCKRDLWELHVKADERSLKMRKSYGYFYYVTNQP